MNFKLPCRFDLGTQPYLLEHAGDVLAPLLVRGNDNRASVKMGLQHDAVSALVGAADGPDDLEGHLLHFVVVIVEQNDIVGFAEQVLGFILGLGLFNAEFHVFNIFVFYT